MTTFEEADYRHLLVVAKSDTSYKPFVRDKLMLSIYDSLRHRKTAVDDASSLTTTIIAKLAKNCSEGRISRLQLVNTASECLKRFDKAAAVYYKAYYAK
jgi:transcriptional regulator NrdR family protein